MDAILDEAGWNENLIRLLVSRGWLTTPEWEAAMRAVPRAEFVPDRLWAVPDSDGRVPRGLDKAMRPVEWLEAVSSDTSLIIQTDDGKGDAATGKGRFTSSLSAPGVVAQFGELLHPMPGHRVLEVGTGSGWTAALLKHLVEDEGEVVSAEIDTEVAQRAIVRLEDGNHEVTVIPDADLAEGAFDRLHVACGVTEVPWAWVDKLRPGGIGVLPWCPPFGLGSKIQFTRLDDRAVGRLSTSAAYMMNRNQRPEAGPLKGWVHHWDGRDVTTTSIDPRSVIRTYNPEDYPVYGGDVAINALAPGIRANLCLAQNGSGEATLWLREDWAGAKEVGSWAQVEYVPNSERFEVKQYGSRRLWEEVSGAYLEWCAWGRPERARFGMTIRPDGQEIWLDHPRYVLHERG